MTFKEDILRYTQKQRDLFAYGLLIVLVMSLGLLLAACGSGDASASSTGTLTGTFVSPKSACPMATDGGSCGPSMVAQQVQIATLTGKVITTVKTNTQGVFTITLPAGKYLVRVLAHRPALLGGREQISVTVVAGQRTTVNIATSTTA